MKMQEEKPGGCLVWESGWLYRRANTTTESGRETERKRRRKRFAPEAPGGG